MSTAITGIQFIGCETDEDRAACCISFLSKYYGVTIEEVIIALQVGELVRVPFGPVAEPAPAEKEKN